MAGDFKVELEGLEELAKRADAPALIGGPLKRFLRRGALVFESEGKRESPVDTGRMRASHTHTLDAKPVPLWAKVGPNTAYAKHVHKRRPWLREAFARKAAEVKGMMADLGNEIREKWNGG